ncbi:MAG: cupin domain-containing protein [Gammaproteobacteria bacterium]
MAPIRKIILSLSLLAVTMIGAQFAQADQDAEGNYVAPEVITPDTLQWGSFDAFPPGAQAAILTGDPRENGYFMIRVKIPPHYKIPPNWQTVKVYATVLEGSYSIGVGNKFNPKTGKTLPSTGSVIIPANTHLYYWSNNGAVLEIHGIGPWDIHYVNPADDPRTNH